MSGLPFPEWSAVLTPLLDVGGIAVFTASGALAAARREQTPVTFAFFAAVTGTGGGTVRDLLIGVPVVWMHDWRLLATCFAVAAMVWVTPRSWWHDRALEWFDAVGLAAYAVFGAAKALHFGIPPLPAAAMGIITACMGGIIRDVLAQEPSILLRPELYVTAAALASGLFVGLMLAGVPMPIAAVIGGLAGFALRALAITRGLALPSYRER
jgi:uncharacterized membrane protein YeiH